MLSQMCLAFVFVTPVLLAVCNDIRSTLCRLKRWHSDAGASFLLWVRLNTAGWSHHLFLIQMFVLHLSLNSRVHVLVKVPPIMTP